MQPFPSSQECIATIYFRPVYALFSSSKRSCRGIDPPLRLLLVSIVPRGRERQRARTEQRGQSSFKNPTGGHKPKSLPDQKSTFGDAQLRLKDIIATPPIAHYQYCLYLPKRIIMVDEDIIP